jgi:hypothetical protein
MMGTPRQAGQGQLQAEDQASAISESKSINKANKSHCIRHYLNV